MRKVSCRKFHLRAEDWRRAAGLSVLATLAAMIFPAAAAAQAINIDLGTGAGLSERVVQLVGLMTVLWDLGARKAVGVRRYFSATFVKDAIPAAITMVGLTALTYLASWWGWFRSELGYNRRWAASNPAV